MEHAAHPPRLSLRRYGRSPGSHTHDGHYQLLWGWQGALELEVEGRGERIAAGRVAVIPAGARHDFHAVAAAAQCFVLDIADAGLDRWAGGVLPAAPALPHLLAYLQAQPLGAPAWAHAVPLLLQSLEGPGPARASLRARPIEWAALQAWVDANLHQPLSVAALAAQVHLSVSQFAARCVERWGMPPQAWVRERRLAAARRLRACGQPVAQVALACGYRSPSALTAALRRAGG